MVGLFLSVRAYLLSFVMQSDLPRLTVSDCQSYYQGLTTAWALMASLPPPCRRTMTPARAGSRLVVRQGSPLLPSDLNNVAASQARAPIIISDQSRSRDEADAQSLRFDLIQDWRCTAVSWYRRLPACRVYSRQTV